MSRFFITYLISTGVVCILISLNLTLYLYCNVVNILFRMIPSLLTNLTDLCFEDALTS